MSISFETVPSALRTPFVAIEFDASNAAAGRTSTQPYRGLLIGQKLASGQATAAIPVRITSEAQAITAFGRGSMLHTMVQAWLKNNTLTELWAISLEDAAAGVAAHGEISVTGPATAAGVISLYIGGQKILVSVANGDTDVQIATKIAAEVNAEVMSPVTASSALEVVTLTAKHKGGFGNEIDVRVNYFQDEALPAGVQLEISALAAGAQNPDLADVITSMGDQQYNVIATAYTDTSNLTKLKDEMDRRFGPMTQIEGVVFAARNATVSALHTFGSALNTQHLSVMGSYKVPTPSYQVAAAVAAVVAHYAPIDPARPFQTLPLKGVMAPAIQHRMTQAERNGLLYDGISTFVVGADGEVKLERVISTYQVSPAGAETDAYLDIETLLTLSYLRYDLRNFILSKYPRHKLASDGTRFGAGQQIVTPRLLKAELLTRFRAWEEAGLVENFDQFKADLIVERSAQDPNRLNVLLPPDAINQLRVTAMKIQFRV